ncbi:hypothetical protein [Halorussus amylolyticus]|uniref:hypothetical protein n=1 Tax=Halorussus amylolyticus TaxID=1126242 RepID=UPI0010539CE1|nr:hypothetical protein [Halorussus amylolyticus]
MASASEIGIVVGLAVLGVGLAGLGVAVGVTAPASDDPASEFAFEGEKLTYSGDETNVTILNDTSAVETVEFEANPDAIEVSVAENRPLSESERDRARETAVANSTVQERLDGHDYESSVEPIRKFDANQSVSVSVSGANETSAGTDENTTTFTVRDDEENDSVIAERPTPSYVPDEAVVRFEHSDAEAFSVVVDFDSGTVLRISS